jgi:hypothetical protein
VYLANQLSSLPQEAQAAWQRKGFEYTFFDGFTSFNNVTMVNVLVEITSTISMDPFSKHPVFTVSTPPLPFFADFGDFTSVSVSESSPEPSPL